MVTEHTHIPVVAPAWSRRDGGTLDEKYRRTHDPFVALAFAAAATEKLVIGTSVCLVIEHDPIVARQADRLAAEPLRRALRVRRRRGLEQAGDAQPRHRPATRHGDMRERVEAMKAIWAQRRGVLPRQARGLRPDLAVAEAAIPPRRCYIGGNGPRVEDRVLRYGDGWMPNMPDLGELRERVAALRERAGRHVPVTFYGANAETLDELRDAGVDRALIVLESVPRAPIPSMP